MIQDLVLEDGEVLRWEARPAPRCYTFRHWRHSIFGLVFLAICSGWQVLGFAVAESYTMKWLAWLPLPFILTGLYFSVGHLVQARVEWSHVYYAITDRRVFAQRGLVRPLSTSVALAEMTYFSLQRMGEQLGTLRVHDGMGQKLVLHCIEHPQPAVKLLEEAIKKNDKR